MHNISSHLADPSCVVRLCKFVLVVLSLDFVYYYCMYNRPHIALYLAKGQDPRLPRLACTRQRERF